MNGLLFAALATPWTMLLACLSAPVRARMAAILPLAPLPALGAALLCPSGTTVSLERPVLPLTFVLDREGALLLGMVSLLWAASGVFAVSSPIGRAERGRWTICWLLTLAGNIGVFAAADLTTFFLAYALVSIPAYGLVVTDAVTDARRAGAVYLGFALFGEALLLLSLVMLAAGTPRGSLSIGDAMTGLPGSPWRAAALGLIIFGFGAKIGLAPLHPWMPLTYRAAPIAAASVLSGAASKAGVIGLIRFLPLGTASPDWGFLLAAFGLFSAFYGVAIGVTQTHARTILAYSSVSQLGLTAAVLGMGLALGSADAGLAAAFYAARHVLAKGALFLAIGVVASWGPRRLWPLLIPTALVALGMAGLPLTGGAVPKLALKQPMGEGLAATLAAISAAGSTALMVHFLRRLAAMPRDGQAQPATSRAAWLVMAIAAIVVPWALAVIAEPSFAVRIFNTYVLWQTLWPILIGMVLAVVVECSRARLPRVPEGDVIVLGPRMQDFVRVLGLLAERTDSRLRNWPTATICILLVATMLCIAAITRR